MTTLQQRETGYTFDTLLEFESGSLAAASENSAALDLGAAGAGDNEDGVAIFRGDVVFDFSAIEIATGDELYIFHVVGSDNADFSTGDQEDLASLRVGDASVLLGDVDSDPGRYVLSITNHRNTRVYRFIRIELVVAGTIATGINWKAFLSIPKNVR